jgi:hypothetical protein
MAAKLIVELGMFSPHRPPDSHAAVFSRRYKNPRSRSSQSFTASFDGLSVYRAISISYDAI